MSNNRIVRIDDMLGTNWTALGTAGSGTGQFNFPVGIFVDSGGKIFVGDHANHRIVRMDDITGAGWTALGALGSGPGQFSFPTGVFVR